MKSTEEQNNQQSNWGGKDLTTVPQKIILKIVLMEMHRELQFP